MSNDRQAALAEPWLTPALILFFIFVATLGLTGGTSRGDETGQFFVRTVSLVLIAALQFTTVTRKPEEVRPAFAIIGGTALLIVLQLVPLPPSIWTSLPGRESFIAAAAIADMPQPWRSLNITPDLGLNSLFGLAPPLTMIIFMLHLRERDNPAIAIAIVTLALVSALTGLAQVADGSARALRLYTVTSEALPVGLFANRNHQALLLAVSLPMLAVLVVQHVLKTKGRSDSVGKIGAGAVAILLIGMLILTGSRTGLVAGLLASAFSFAFLRGIRRQARTKKQILVLFGNAVVLVALAIIILARWPLVAERLASNPFDDHRFRVLPTLIDLTTTYFPAGSGFGSFDAVYRHAEPFALLGPEYINRAHNEFFELAIEGGLLAITGVAAFMTMWIVHSWRAWSAPLVAPSAMFARLGVATTALLLLASLLDYPLRMPMLSTVFMAGFCWMVLCPTPWVARPN